LVGGSIPCVSEMMSTFVLMVGFGSDMVICTVVKVLVSLGWMSRFSAGLVSNTASWKKYPLTEHRTSGFATEVLEACQWSF
jgi:hypothetical protein